MSQHQVNPETDRCVMCGRNDLRRANHPECEPAPHKAAAPPPANDDMRVPSDEECRKVINRIAGDWHHNLTDEQVYALSDKYLRPLLAQVAARARFIEHGACCEICNSEKGPCERGAELQKAVGR